MRSKLVLLAVCALLARAADKKGPPTATAANDKLEISATLYGDKDAVRGELGSDLGGYFTLVRVQIAPKGAKALAISRDDFVLRAYNDGQKCAPFEPSQIAGRGALVVSSTNSGGGTTMESPGGPIWGGLGGSRPRRMGGDSPNVGNSAGSGSAQATLSDDAQEDPILTVLKQKMLADKETAEPLSGLLYFALEGKHKPKDLALQYRGPGGRLDLAFK
jgi:hypothetical protein